MVYSMARPLNVKHQQQGICFITRKSTGNLWNTTGKWLLLFLCGSVGGAYEWVRRWEGSDEIKLSSGLSLSLSYKLVRTKGERLFCLRAETKCQTTDLQFEPQLPSKENSTWSVWPTRDQGKWREWPFALSMTRLSTGRNTVHSSLVFRARELKVYRGTQNEQKRREKVQSVALLFHF